LVCSGLTRNFKLASQKANTLANFAATSDEKKSNVFCHLYLIGRWAMAKNLKKNGHMLLIFFQQILFEVLRNFPNLPHHYYAKIFLKKTRSTFGQGEGC
jgi:hypothetical protein